MAAKDFTAALDVNPVYSVIAEATAAQEITENEETTQTEETKRARKTYTDEEAQEFLANLKTAGRKGVKLPRLNMAFSPDVYDYIRTMSKVSGITLTEFVNKVMKQYMDEHMEQYEKAIEFRNSL